MSSHGNSRQGVLRDALAGALDLVFAPVCVACRRQIAAGSTDRLVCGLCWSRVRPIPAPRCERCWTPVARPATRCGVCKSFPPHLRVARSALLMEGPVRGVVSALKYRGWEAVAGPLAERMARVPLPEDVVEEASIVVPVPTSGSRMRERGYNQAERLADELARRMDRTHLPEGLERRQGARTQTALQRGERRANVARAFAVPERHRGRVAGEHVILVDDVWTTGATALSGVLALVEGGARLVSVITAARAPLPSNEREGIDPS